MICARGCRLSGSALLRLCPGCGAELCRFAEEGGQLALYPLPGTGDARPALFALMDGGQLHRPLTCARVEDRGPRAPSLGLSLSDGRAVELPIGAVLLAAAEGREWVGVGQ
jgi:hypothetical protein